MDEGSRSVSSSDEEKVIADRVRVGHRTERVQLRDLVCVLETKSVTGKTLEVHAASVHKFFDWSGFLRSSTVKTLEEDRSRGVHEPAILKEPPGLERQDTVGKNFLLADFLTDEEKANDAESPVSQKRKTCVAKVLETIATNGRLHRLERGCVQSRRYVGSCAHLITLFV